MGVNSFALKVIAVMGMSLNHIGYIFQEALPFEIYALLITCGGLTFPIMAFLVAEGYKHTSDYLRYSLRLLIFAVISQIPYSVFIGAGGNILFTLLLGLIVIRLYSFVKRKSLILLFFPLVIGLNVFLDWSPYGALMVFWFHWFRNTSFRVVAPFLLPATYELMKVFEYFESMQVVIIPNLLFTYVGCSMAIVLLYFYNGKQGKKLKYFFYIFYPAHITIIGLTRDLFF